MKQKSSAKHFENGFFARAYARIEAISLVRTFNRLNCFVALLIVLFASGICLAKQKSRKLDDRVNFRHHNKKIREKAVLDAGHNRDDKSVSSELLDAAHDDTDLSVRTAALQSLGNRQEATTDLKQILTDSTEALSVREAAASGLALSPLKENAQFLIDKFNSADGELKEHIKLCLENYRNKFPELVMPILGESQQ